MNLLWGTLWLGTGIYWVIGILAVIWNLIRLPPNFQDKGYLSIRLPFYYIYFWNIYFLLQQ